MMICSGCVMMHVLWIGWFHLTMYVDVDVENGVECRFGILCCFFRRLAGVELRDWIEDLVFAVCPRRKGCRIRDREE